MQLYIKIMINMTAQVILNFGLDQLKKAKLKGKFWAIPETTEIAKVGMQLHA